MNWRFLKLQTCVGEINHCEEDDAGCKRDAEEEERLELLSGQPVFQVLQEGVGLEESKHTWGDRSEELQCLKAAAASHGVEGAPPGRPCDIKHKRQTLGTHWCNRVSLHTSLFFRSIFSLVCQIRFQRKKRDAAVLLNHHPCCLHPLLREASSACRGSPASPRLSLRLSAGQLPWY